jgi:thiamine pyrophosphokinase
MHVVIFTGGVLRPGRAVDQALAAADLIIAADSGADNALKFHRQPAAVVGDLDSIDPEVKRALEQTDCRFVVSPAEKDQTDTELAVQYALGRGATRLTILGGIESDRIDHILANVFYMIQIPVPATFINGTTTAWVAKGPATVPIPGTPADLLSLLPLTAQVTGLHTTGLQYALGGHTLSMYETLGISNVLTASEAGVTFSRGLLLFIHIDSTSSRSYRTE